MLRFTSLSCVLLAGCSALGLPIVDGTEAGTTAHDGGVSDAGGATPPDLTISTDAGQASDMLRAPDFAGVDMTVSAAPCLTGGSVAYLDGDAADWIHPGSELIPVAHWSPRSTDDDTFWYESPYQSDGSGGWSFGFSSLAMSTPLAVGRYDNAMALGSVSPGRAGLGIGGGGRICSNITGWFEIQSIAGGPVDGTYTELTATFEQHCSGLSGSLRGCVHFEAQP